jgi:hypothetical protein
MKGKRKKETIGLDEWEKARGATVGTKTDPIALVPIPPGAFPVLPEFERSAAILAAPCRLEAGATPEIRKAALFPAPCSARQILLRYRSPE